MGRAVSVQEEEGETGAGMQEIKAEEDGHFCHRKVTENVHFTMPHKCMEVNLHRTLALGDTVSFLVWRLLSSLNIKLYAYATELTRN